MNLKRIVDAIQQVLFQILDAYHKQECLGTKKELDEETGEWKRAEKQVIPSREAASQYAKDTDLYRYIAYIDGSEKVKTPHYTGSYFCPYCNGWHLTTHDTTDLKEHTKKRCRQAWNKNIWYDYPEDCIITELYSMPDYTDEEIKQGRIELAKKARNGK